MNPSTHQNARQPLEGVTVIDLTQVLAGPMATMMLGDLGAEVVKVEAVGRGDISRGWEPSPHYFDANNRNKQSIAVDLKTEEGQEVVHRLLADADVFVENMKPGRPERFALDYERVREINSDIVYCSIKGFGRDSPYENVPAMDVIIQALSGVMSVTGETDGPPLWSGLPSGDLAPAMYAVQSIVSALFARERGLIEGEFLEVPMFDTTLSWLGVRAGYSFKFDEPFPRSGTQHPTAEPFGVFECDDDQIVALASTPTLWEGFCECVDRPDLLEDERFASNELRLQNRDQLRGELDPEFATESVDHWAEVFHENEVPAAPIYDTLSVWEDDHVQRRDLRQTVPREGREDAEVIDNPVQFTNLETTLEGAPPALGEDTDDILAGIGYDKEAIRTLKESGAIE